MMLEDPAAVAQATGFANLKGYSVLACGIGSLRGALKGDTAAAEAGTQKVLAETRRTRPRTCSRRLRRMSSSA